MNKNIKSIAAATLRRWADRLDPRQCIQTLPLESGVRYEGKAFKVVPLRAADVIKSHFGEEQLVYNVKNNRWAMASMLAMEAQKAVVITERHESDTEVYLDGLLLILTPEL